MRRFSVDEVAPASERLPTRPLGERYAEALAIGGDASTPVIDHGGTHPLLAAVGRAFAEHRPLTLSPDAVWLTIAQGVAQHVRLHAETLRPRLVRHQGHKQLMIRTNALPTDATGWANAVATFRSSLADEIGDGRARLFECDFSTSTDTDRLASQIVLLDAYSPYFSYWIRCVCGIPEITLLGTADDWRRIRERIDVIAELDLDFWCQSLRPIADQLVRAAAGDIDVAFWRRIYNPVDAYGGDVITGWITRLYPYVKQAGVANRRNPMLELPIDEPRNRTTKLVRWYDGPGLRSDDVPALTSRVTVRVVDQASQQLRSVAFVAGVTAVTQDDDGSLRPITGWHLEAAQPRIGDVVERLCAEHDVVRATGDREQRELTGPAEVVELFSHIERATLFAGERTWRLRSPREHQYVEVERAGQFSVDRVADLPSGQSLCAASRIDPDVTYWLLCHVEEDESPAVEDTSEIQLPRGSRAVELPSEIRVLGTSLAAILDAALASNGDVDHLELCRFDDLLRIP